MIDSEERMRIPKGLRITKTLGEHPQPADDGVRLDAVAFREASRRRVGCCHPTRFIVLPDRS